MQRAGRLGAGKSVEETARRSLDLANDLADGANCVAAVHYSASGFPGAERRLQRLGGALTAIARGDAVASFKVGRNWVSTVEGLGALVASWQQTGRGRAKVEAEAKKVLRWLRLTRMPRRKKDLCLLCQEQGPFFGGRAGGVCADCIRQAYEALAQTQG